MEANNVDVERKNGEAGLIPFSNTAMDSVYADTLRFHSTIRGSSSPPLTDEVTLGQYNTFHWCLSRFRVHFDLAMRFSKASGVLNNKYQPYEYLVDATAPILTGICISSPWGKSGLLTPSFRICPLSYTVERLLRTWVPGAHPACSRDMWPNNSGYRTTVPMLVFYESLQIVPILK